MNHNRKRREAAARERRRREEEAARQQKQREAALKNDALVDPAALAPCNNYGTPDFLARGYYLDMPFTCASCGSEEVWTAPQQKWWYETAKGSIYSVAKHCRTCRHDARRHKGKAHPLQNLNRWLGLIRDSIEPGLLAADWRPVVGAGETHPYVLSYDRDDVLIRFRWGLDSYRSILILERRDAFDAPFRTLTQIEVDPSNITHEELQRRFDRFLTAARNELGLDPTPP
jgi:hypothetical protein